MCPRGIFLENLSNDFDGLTGEVPSHPSFTLTPWIKEIATNDTRKASWENLLISKRLTF